MERELSRREVAGARQPSVVGDSENDFGVVTDQMETRAFRSSLLIKERDMLELYQFEECEFSAQVRLKMSEWEIDCILRNVSQDKSNRLLLKKISGRSETPTLVDSTRDVILVGDKKRSFATSGNILESAAGRNLQDRNAVSDSIEVRE